MKKNLIGILIITLLLIPSATNAAWWDIGSWLKNKKETPVLVPKPSPATPSAIPTIVPSENAKTPAVEKIIEKVIEKPVEKIITRIVDNPELAKQVSELTRKYNELQILYVQKSNELDTIKKNLADLKEASIPKGKTEVLSSVCIDVLNDIAAKKESAQQAILDGAKELDDVYQNATTPVGFNEKINSVKKASEAKTDNFLKQAKLQQEKFDLMCK